MSDKPKHAPPAAATSPMDDRARQLQFEIEERKRAEEDLRESEGRFRAILDNTTSVVTLKALDGVYLFVNRRFEDLFGVKGKQIDAKTDYDVFPADIADILRAHDREVLDKNEVMEFEEEWPQKDGLYTYISVRFPLRHPSGDVYGICCISTDITKLKRTEDRLRLSEERFRSMSDSVVDAIIAADADGNIISWNHGACETFGYDEAEVIGKPLTMLMPSEFRETHTQALRRFRDRADRAASVFKRRAQLTGLRKDGREFPLELTLGSWKTGNDIFFSGVVRDITEHTIYEQELSRLKTRFETILNSAGEGIFGIDQAGKLVFANPAAANLLGWDSDELFGIESHNLFHNARPGGLPDRAEDYPIAATAIDGETREIEEDWFKRKDGTKFPVKYVASPMIANDELSGAVVVFSDITAIKQAEMLIAEKSAYLDNILRSMVDMAIVATDLDYRILYFNPNAENIFGYTAEQVIGRTVLDIHEMEHVEPARFEQAIANVREKREHCYEVQAEKADGTHITSSRVNGIWNEDEDLVGFILMSQDVTAARKAENELSEKTRALQVSNDDLQQFAYAASHDLREPLRMVSSYIQLLERKYGTILDKAAHEYMHFAIDGAQRMDVMIRDLLQLSRVETQGEEFVKVNIQDVLEEVRDNLQATIADTFAAVSFHDLPEILADRSQMVRLFQNLISNALKYSHPDRPPEIHVSAERVHVEWKFSVQDNGIGIDPAHFERVFQIFQRLHGRNEYEGTGIGLAVCKKIVERHGGRIWVESTLEKGSRFGFSLPLVTNPENREA